MTAESYVETIERALACFGPFGRDSVLTIEAWHEHGPGREVLSVRGRDLTARGLPVEVLRALQRRDQLKVVPAVAAGINAAPVFPLAWCAWQIDAQVGTVENDAGKRISDWVIPQEKSEAIRKALTRLPAPSLVVDAALTVWAGWRFDEALDATHVLPILQQLAHAAGSSAPSDPSRPLPLCGPVRFFTSPAPAVTIELADPTRTYTVHDFIERISDVSESHEPVRQPASA